MNLESVTLQNKDYYILDNISLENTIYYFLIDEETNKDICIRKKIKENGKEYLVKLKDEEEFSLVMKSYLNNTKKIDTDVVLPIGTIVELNDCENMVMIIGFLMSSRDGLIYDYCGCEYPMGLLNKNDYLYFDKSNIIGLKKMGYINKEVLDVLEKVSTARKSLYDKKIVDYIDYI